MKNRITYRVVNLFTEKKDSHFDFLFVPEPVVLVALALAAVVQLLHDIHSCNRLVLHKHHPEVLRAPIFLRTGCRNLQFDDCVWGGMVNPELAVALTGREGAALESYKKTVLELNNQVIAQAPKDLIINTHVCRGNYHSTYFSSGAYDGVADLLFGEENVNAYYLEYDDERSGGFAPLKKVSEDKKVVLGLITTKKPDLEDKEKVIARIHEAAKYVPLDRLYLSPQCGFASCEIGNKLTEEEQWAKLKLVKEIADEVWSDR